MSKKTKWICSKQEEFIKDTAKSELDIKHMERTSDKHCKIIVFKNFNSSSTLMASYIFNLFNENSGATIRTVRGSKLVDKKGGEKAAEDKRVRSISALTLFVREESVTERGRGTGVFVLRG